MFTRQFQAMSLVILTAFASHAYSQVGTEPGRAVQQTEELALIGLKKKDHVRIVFLGDSITQSGVSRKGYVTLLLDALKAKHEEKVFEIIGAGVSGNKVPDLQARLDKDVIAKTPDVVVIYIGINDVWHSQDGKGTPKDIYEKGLKDIIARIKNANSRVILCTPSVIGEKTDGSNKLDTMLEEYSEISRRVAKETSTTLIDLRKQFIHELKTKNPEQKAQEILTSDGVHLNDAGNTFVKDCMVSTVEAVALGKQVVHVVMFKFKPTTCIADINRVSEAFAELPKKIAGITEFQSGSDISPENLSQGYSHCYILKFVDLPSRDAYLTHEAHQEFVKLAIPFVETPLVVDFWEK